MSLICEVQTTLLETAGTQARKKGLQFDKEEQEGTELGRKRNKSGA